MKSDFVFVSSEDEIRLGNKISKALNVQDHSLYADIIYNDMDMIVVMKRHNGICCGVSHQSLKDLIDDNYYDILEVELQNLVGGLFL